MKTACVCVWRNASAVKKLPCYYETGSIVRSVSAFWCWVVGVETWLCGRSKPSWINELSFRGAYSRRQEDGLFGIEWNILSIHSLVKLFMSPKRFNILLHYSCNILCVFLGGDLKPETKTNHYEIMKWKKNRKWFSCFKTFFFSFF